MVPHEFHVELLTAAKTMNPKGTWVLDLFCGTGSLRSAAAELGFDYAGVDIRDKIYKGRADHKLLYNRPDIVEDLFQMDLDDVIFRAGKLIGRASSELLMTWASPPCITFSQLDRLRKPEKRHRDLSTPTRVAISEEAKRDDRLVAHVAKELVKFANGKGTKDNWKGLCISLQQPLASQVVGGQVKTVSIRNHLDRGQWIAVHASKSLDYIGNEELPRGAFIGFIFTRQAGQRGKWTIEGSVSIEPVRAKGFLNLTKVDGLFVPDALKHYHARDR
jgi:hypothetical protein